MFGLIRRMNGRIYIRSLITYSFVSTAEARAKELWKEGHAVHVERVRDDAWVVWRTI